MHLFENPCRQPRICQQSPRQDRGRAGYRSLMPPIVHIGFGTLGHSWFNNFAGVRQLADKMGTGCAAGQGHTRCPYGTMYWFRTGCAAPDVRMAMGMGGLQQGAPSYRRRARPCAERLIGYCACAAGYRVVSVMTTQSAARNYAKLEYKMQRLMSHLSSGNVVDQGSRSQAAAQPRRGRLFHLSFETYRRILIRWPASRRWLRPVAQGGQPPPSSSLITIHCGVSRHLHDCCCCTRYR